MAPLLAPRFPAPRMPPDLQTPCKPCKEVLLCPPPATPPVPAPTTAPTLSAACQPDKLSRPFVISPTQALPPASVQAACKPCQPSRAPSIPMSPASINTCRVPGAHLCSSLTHCNPRKPQHASGPITACWPLRSRDPATWATLDPLLGLCLGYEKTGMAKLKRKSGTKMGGGSRPKRSDIAQLERGPQRTFTSCGVGPASIGYWRRYEHLRPKPAAVKQSRSSALLQPAPRHVPAPARGPSKATKLRLDLLLQRRAASLAAESVPDAPMPSSCSSPWVPPPPGSFAQQDNVDNGMGPDVLNSAFADGARRLDPSVDEDKNLDAGYL